MTAPATAYPLGAGVRRRATGRRSSRRASSTRTRTRSSATSPPAATRACEPRSASRRPTPQRGQERHPARPRRRRLPGRREVGAHPAGRVAALPRGQRRRERAGHVQGPAADGARPAPADRGLPHRLLRRRLSQCFLYIRGEMAARPGRVATALNEAYAAGYIGKNILGTDFSVDIVLHWGAGAYVVGEETALIESLEGNRGMPRLKPPYFPAADRPVRPADDRQQRRDAVEPAVARPQRRRRVHRDRHRDLARHAHGRRVRPRRAARCVRDRQRHDHVPRPAVRRRLLRRHPRRQRAEGVRARRRLGAVVPRRPARPPVRGQAGRRRPARCSAPGRSW